MKRLLFCLGVCLGIVILSLCVSGQAPTDYDALVRQGNAQLQAGSNDLALATAQSAIKLNTDRWEAYALAGGALMNLKRYEEAADQFSMAIQHAPESKQTALRDLRKQCLAAELGLSAPSPPPPASQPTSSTTTQAEIVLWKSIEASDNPDDFQGYLTQYPNGAFVVLAKRHLAELQHQLEQHRAQEAAARGLLPVATQLFQGTLVKQGGLVFMAVPGYPSISSIFQMVLVDGQPSFGTRWTYASPAANHPKRTAGGVLYFQKAQVIIDIDGANRETFPTSSVAATSNASWGTGGYSPVRLVINSQPKDPIFLMTGDHIADADNSDKLIVAFINRLLQDWDGVLSQIRAVGIDLRTLPDSATFDLRKANGAISLQHYCLCPSANGGM